MARLPGITWLGGEPPSDPSILEELPPELSSVLQDANGFILHGGCLHVRGAVTEPGWHSIRAAWRGDSSLAALYGVSEPLGIPFAQDCVGDQFVLRDGLVWTFSAETGSLERTDRSLAEFLDAAASDPMGTLAPEPLLRFQRERGRLAPGRLLLAYPPFCTNEAAAGVTLTDVPVDELLRFHAELARRLAGIPDGATFEMTITD